MATVKLSANERLINRLNELPLGMDGLVCEALAEKDAEIGRLQRELEAAEAELQREQETLRGVTWLKDQAETALATVKQTVTEVMARLVPAVADAAIVGATYGHEQVVGIVDRVAAAIAAEQAKRCGTCADWQQRPRYGTGGICRNPDSPCWFERVNADCGGIWPADHGCLCWRAKEGA